MDEGIPTLADSLAGKTPMQLQDLGRGRGKIVRLLDPDEEDKTMPKKDVASAVAPDPIPAAPAPAAERKARGVAKGYKFKKREVEPPIADACLAIDEDGTFAISPAGGAATRYAPELTARILRFLERTLPKES